MSMEMPAKVTPYGTLYAAAKSTAYIMYPVPALLYMTLILLSRHLAEDVPR